MLNKTEDTIIFEQQCVVDQARVFYYSGKVYRAIYNKEQVQLYLKLFKEVDMNRLFEQGLVATKISDDIKPDNCDLVLLHETIDFFLEPSEMTDSMFWEAALCYVRLCKILSENDLILKDAHPWNLTFHKGKPVFFDFASIESSKSYNEHWLNEFYSYFAVPIMLAGSKKWKHLAQDYRRQHLNGFGLQLAEHKYIKKLFFRSFFKLSGHLNAPSSFLEKLEKWILKFQPIVNTGTWDSYEQGHAADFKNPVTIKQKFVHGILAKHKPNKVVDLATNKGYYAFMAENLGAHVIGFDYEAPSIDIARQSIEGRNITFCQMNFLTPSSKHGWGLILPDAFKRFYSDIAITLGLIHHICLVQSFPVKLFCDSCSRYASKGVILEFIYPEDTHVSKWNAKIPEDYSKESIKQYFAKHYKGFEESEMFTENGAKRQFFFFFSD